MIVGSATERRRTLAPTRTQSRLIWRGRSLSATMFCVPILHFP
jgi:hypothetical protein